MKSLHMKHLGLFLGTTIAVTACADREVTQVRHDDNAALQRQRDEFRKTTMPGGSSEAPAPGGTMGTGQPGSTTDPYGGSGSMGSGTLAPGSGSTGVDSMGTMGADPNATAPGDAKLPDDATMPKAGTTPDSDKPGAMGGMMPGGAGDAMMPSGDKGEDKGMAKDKAGDADKTGDAGKTSGKKAKHHKAKKVKKDKPMDKPADAK
jgi:hypothetical protein